MATLFHILRSRPIDGELAACSARVDCERIAVGGFIKQSLLVREAASFCSDRCVLWMSCAQRPLTDSPNMVHSNRFSLFCTPWLLTILHAGAGGMEVLVPDV